MNEENLIEASYNSDIYTMQEILDNNEHINVNIIDMNSQNILMIYLQSRLDPHVIVNDRDEINFIRYLVFWRHININAQDIDGNTALMIAIEFYSDSIDIIDILIRHTQINVNIQNNDGVDALMYAAASGNYEIVNMLLEAGANVNSIDNDEFTPIDYAHDNGFVDIVNILIEAGGNITRRYKTLKNKETMKNTMIPYLSAIRLQRPDTPGDISYEISKFLMYPSDGKKKKSNKRKKKL